MEDPGKNISAMFTMVRLLLKNKFKYRNKFSYDVQMISKPKVHNALGKNKSAYR